MGVHNNVVGMIVLLAVAMAAGCSQGMEDAGRTPDSPSGSAKKQDAGTSKGTGSGTGGGMSFGNSDAGGAPMLIQTPVGADAGPGIDATFDGHVGSENACGIGMATAERTPVNMFVMFDRSNSMNDNDKWPNATAALTSFFKNPSADRLSVALRFFPHDMPAVGCTRDGCSNDAESAAVACSQPLVPIGTLTADSAPNDTQEDALVMAIANSAPGTSGIGANGGGGTPIYAALDGALRWASDYQSMHADEKTVVIFVTDGEPNGCDQDFNNISLLASNALSTSGVSTYAIGLEGSSEAQMDQLAAAGGTNNGIFIGNSANAEEELLTALTAIQGETLSCDFPMPKPIDKDMKIDPAKINVTFTPGGGMPATLRQVTDEDACKTSKAWHYDKADKPTRIVLCPAACDLVRAEPDAKVEILLGCETVCGGLDVDCGNSPPPEVPPVIID
jgi:hypothetical protein